LKINGFLYDLGKLTLSNDILDKSNKRHS